jgi:hypothetical protein
MLFVDMNGPLIETWNVHNRIHLYLLEAISEEALGAVVHPKSRSVWALFAHIHNVRLMWLKSAAPDLLEGLPKIDSKPIGTRELLRTGFVASGGP